MTAHKLLLLNRLAAFAAIAALLATAPAGLARTRKGDKLLKEGKLAEVKKDWDRALELYEQALADDPTDPAYQMAAQRVRFQAGQKHVENGLKLREEGTLEEAAAEFQKGYATDPSSGMALNELRKTLRMIEDRKRKDTGGVAAKPAVTPAEEARQQLESRIESMLPAPILKPITQRVDSLTMTNQPPRILYETVGKLVGINVIMDPEFQAGRNASVELANMPLEQALDHIALITKTFWKALAPNTIFVTNDNVTKRRDYEEMVVKSYYIKNITTPQELQEISTIMRSVCDIRRVFTYNSQNVIVVRGEADRVALCDKLAADLDKPKSEVVVDVIVMEASRARTRDLAATLVSGSSNGLSVPISFVPRAGLAIPSSSDDNGSDDSGAGSVRLNNLRRISSGDFALTLPGALLQALMTDAGTRIIQSPQVRASDSAKSSLHVGDRYPYATGSFQPGVGAVGVSPLVSTQFQFAEVGVKVDITPKIHGYDETSLQVDINISQVRETIDLGGVEQPVIGQRQIIHNVRLRHGEVSLIGGLRQEQESRSVSGTPGLGHIPLLKRLFTAEGVDKNESELLIALVPHIVRAPDISELNLRGVAAGTDAVVKLNYAPANGQPAARPTETPKPAEPPKQGDSPKPVVPGLPTATIPGLPVTPGVKPEPPATANTPPQLPPGVPGAPPPAETPKPDPAATPAASGSPRLAFLPAAVTAKVGAPATVTLHLEGASDVSGAPMVIRWDPKILRLNEVARGNLLAADGQQPIFTRNIRNDAGEANILLNRLPGTRGITGSGALVTLVFQPVARGATQVTFADFSLRNSQMQPVAVAAPSLQITVE